MTPRPAHWGISFVLLLACGEDPPAPTPAPEVAVAPPAEPPPTEDKIYEVILASTPTGAHVLLSGAEIGTTPHPLKFKRKTTVQVVADAYLPAEITVDETSDPNIVVTLQPDPAAATATGGGAGTPGDAGTVGDAKPSDGKTATASTTKTPTSDASKSSPSKPAAPTQPTTDPSTPKPASSLPYPNVSSAKSDYQSGKIDRDAYDQAVRKLKARRNAKIEVIRAKYQAGEFDKDEYNRRKRIIDNEYKGGV